MFLWTMVRIRKWVLSYFVLCRVRMCLWLPTEICQFMSRSCVCTYTCTYLGSMYVVLHPPQGEVLLLPPIWLDQVRRRHYQGSRGEGPRSHMFTSLVWMYACDATCIHPQAAQKYIILTTIST